MPGREIPQVSAGDIIIAHNGEACGKNRKGVIKMRLVIQRVKRAEVAVFGEYRGRIGQGYVALLGVVAIVQTGGRIGTPPHGGAPF